MATEALIKAVEQQEALDRISDQIQPLVRGAFKSTGPAGREVKNFLHGTWLGHPLHPALTDVPLGAWTAALALDAMESISGRRELAAGADAAIAVGLVGAAGAAVTGLTDWSETSGRARKVGILHGLMNVGATVLYTTSLILRRKKKRKCGSGLRHARLRRFKRVSLPWWPSCFQRADRSESCGGARDAERVRTGIARR